MHRRIQAIPFALLAIVLSGCVRPSTTPQAALVEGGAYVCRLGDNVATPGPALQLLVRPAAQRGQLLVRFDRDAWQALDEVRGSSGQIYANEAYAWRSNAAGGVLTDIRNIETYNCTSDAGTPRQGR